MKESLLSVPNKHLPGGFVYVRLNLARGSFEENYQTKADHPLQARSFTCTFTSTPPLPPVSLIWKRRSPGVRCGEE